MAFDVKEHFLVPRHSLLDSDSVEQIISELGIDKSKLPKLPKGYPAIKEFKPKKGDIVKINRYSPTAGKTTYYRIVD